MPKKVADLEELFQDELRDIYDAEKQLVRALPRMAKAAGDEELANALREHLEVTKGQVQRIEQVFESLDVRAKSKLCKGMKGIVEEGAEMMQEGLEETLLDSALAGAGRKVEHYEMMAYDSVANMAKQLGHTDAAQLLQETLREEMEADKTLAQIGKRLLKMASAGRQSEEEQQPARPAGRGGNSRSKSGGSARKGRSRESSSKEGHTGLEF